MIRTDILGLGLSVALALVPVAHAQPPSPAAATGGGSGDPAAGEQIFANLCGFCHQNGGRVAGRGPKLAGTDRPDDYLVNRIRTGKEGAMPAYGRAFTEAQVRSLVAYIRSLKADGQ
jgi:mono/diheme cytochrome c family protein